MPTKKPVKKESIEKKHQEENKVLQKEEIKEIVEETVEDTLEKLAEEPLEKREVEEEKTEEKPVIPTIVMPSESSEDGTKEATEETPAEENEAAKTPSPVMPEVVTSEAPQVESKEEKTETEAASSIPGVTSPAGPSGEVVSTANGASIQPKKKFSLLGIFLLIILLGALAGGGWYAYTQNMIPSQLFSLAGLKTQPTPTHAAKSLPTDTPTPTVDLTQYTIAVLNGSGVPGAAAKVKSDLTTAGFTVNSVGNASTSNATDTVIAAKSAVSKDYLTKLTEELQKTYAVSATIASLDDSATTDVTVTIGSAPAH